MTRVESVGDTAITLPSADSGVGIGVIEARPLVEMSM
jgi:hypothetical protein